MYITDLICISPQQTYDGSFSEGAVIGHTGNRYQAIEPSYGGLIPAGLLRRMGKAVRMGVGVGLPLIERNSAVEAIILGTGNGGLEDCLKFLNQIVDYEEGTLTPTNFVQSTPNAVAGNLALMSKNTGYNATHVHKGLAFESALLDTLLLLKEEKAKSVLLGSVEEISDYNFNIDFLSGSFRLEESDSVTLFKTDAPGTVCGEGAVMFVVEAELSARCVAEIRDVEQISHADRETLVQKLTLFLHRNGLEAADVDGLIIGQSGDNRNDHWYSDLRQELFAHSTVYTYKNLVGDYPTASSFATWLGVQILQGKSVPGQAIITVPSNKTLKNILIYNHYKGVQHGFILLSAVS